METHHERRTAISPMDADSEQSVLEDSSGVRIRFWTRVPGMEGPSILMQKEKWHIMLG